MQELFSPLLQYLSLEQIWMLKKVNKEMGKGAMIWKKETLFILGYFKRLELVFLQSLEIKDRLYIFEISWKLRASQLFGRYRRLVWNFASAEDANAPSSWTKAFTPKIQTSRQGCFGFLGGKHTDTHPNILKLSTIFYIESSYFPKQTEITEPQATTFISICSFLSIFCKPQADID